jgi:pyruvate dehydrogenase E2 component (dihydrolipoamide acetyltransferase)
LAVELPLVAREGKPRATPAARKAARDFDVQLQMVQGSGENGRIHRADVEAFAAGRSVESSAIGSPRATPLAQKVAGANGINLDGLQGSGVHGKILREDVTRAMQSQTASVQKENAKTKRVIKLQGMRKIIAERMSQSAYTAPHVTITTSVDMSASKALRTELLPIIEKKTGLRLSYTEILLKAVSSCLIKHPSLNARWDNGEVVLEENTNIGMAVSVKDGLLVPVIFHAQTMGLSELVRAAKEAASKARDNKLKPEDLTGGTFTISNLGMYAVDSFTPIINQPEVAILGVGQIQDKPSVVNGTVEVRPMMTLSLSFDHRVVDGAPAAAFLTDLKSLLEHPYQLLV